MMIIPLLVYIWILIIKVIRFKRYKRNGGIRSKNFWVDIDEAFDDLTPEDIAIAVVSSLAIVAAISGGTYFAYKKLTER